LGNWEFYICGLRHFAAISAMLKKVRANWKKVLYIVTNKLSTSRVSRSRETHW